MEAWVGFFGFLIIMAALNARMLGACIIAAIGMTVVYPNESYAMGLVMVVGVSTVLASFRD